MLSSAQLAWESCAPVRDTRRRLKRFTYGRQWDDITYDAFGNRLTERDHAINSGRRPITNNLLRSLVKSVVGRFRKDLIAARTDKESLASDPIADIRAANFLDELDSRALEEFLISGCAIQRVGFGKRFAGSGIWIDNINPERFFVNRFLDPRGHDIRIIGVLHDMTLPDMIMAFGNRTMKKEREIKRIFAESVSCPRFSILPETTGTEAPAVCFDRPVDPSMCRVIEMWTCEHVRCDVYRWQGRYLSVTGEELMKTDAGAAGHPFIVNLYPLTDGEVHPFIEDVIDQQRHINQLITTIDNILAHSAKGALLFPTDALPRGGSYEDTIRLWSRPGAVIPINPAASRLPSEISSAGRCEGASQLLELEMKMFQQISGVSSALQGQNPSTGMSASLYESQVQNSTIALLDIFETFNSFRSARDAKVLRVKESLSRQ